MIAPGRPDPARGLAAAVVAHQVRPRDAARVALLRLREAARRAAALARSSRALPLYEYSLWIAQREFAFFRHVAFDQLVTPQTAYLDRPTIERWLRANPRIAPDSTYVIMRNGNSWKFGGTRAMRFLLVNYEYPPLGGGAANATMFIASALRGSSATSRVVLTGALRRSPATCVEDGVLVHRRSAHCAARRIGPIRVRWRASCWPRCVAARRIAREPPHRGRDHILHASLGPGGWSLDGDAWAFPTSSRCAAATSRGIVPGSAASRPAAPLAAPVLAARARGRRQFGEPRASFRSAPIPSPVQVIPNGVDCDFFRPDRLGQQRGRPASGSSPSAACSRQRTSTCCARGRALAPQPATRCRPRHRGRRARRAPRLETLAVAGLSGRVTWHGWRSKRDVAALYRGAALPREPVALRGNAQHGARGDGERGCPSSRATSAATTRPSCMA